MNIRDFLDVRVICETGSLRKSAVVLGVTQPTLSTRIARLEDQLGAPLFDRSRGQSRPTDLALFIARRTASVAEEVDCLAKEVRRLASGRAGLVRIGLGPAPTRILLAEIVATVADRFPDISLELTTGRTQQLTDGLIRRDLDLLVCTTIDSEHESIASEQLLEAEIVVVANADHPMCADPPADITGLFRYPIASTFLEQRYYNILRSHGIDIDGQVGRVVCSDFDMLVRIVSNSNRLFTAGPRIAFDTELASGILRVIDVPMPYRHVIALHVNADAFPLPAVMTVKDTLRRAFSTA